LSELSREDGEGMKCVETRLEYQESSVAVEEVIHVEVQDRHAHEVGHEECYEDFESYEYYVEHDAYEEYEEYEAYEEYEECEAWGYDDF
jgi:hypothetical protein